MIYKLSRLIYSNGKLLLPLIFLLLGLVLIYSHNLFEESDGVFHFFSALEIIDNHNYNNWASNFWPPFYPLIASFLLPYFSGFFILKIISLISGFVILLVIYDICYEFTLNSRVALFTQALTFCFSGFLVSSIQAEKHILDTCFTILSV